MVSDQPRPRRIHYVLKLDIPAILELRVTRAPMFMLDSLLIDRRHISLTRGEYLEPSAGEPMPALTHRRVILKAPRP